MLNFFHNYLPRPVFLQLGPVQVHWYGLLIVAAIILGFFLAVKLAARRGIKADEVIDLGFYLVIFSVIGARIYAVLLFWQYYFQNPWEIIAVWHGGLAIHGAIIGGLITLLIYCWQKKQALQLRSGQAFWLWADIIVPVLALGQAIGRWGNYFNQENFGWPTNLPWGIPIALANRPPGFEQFTHFQPAFFYESVLDLLNFIILILLFWRLNKRRSEIRDQKSEIRKQKSENRNGLVFLIYLINYSIIRILLEFLRIDVTPVIFGIRWPIIASALIIIFSVITVILSLRGTTGVKRRE